MLVMTMRMDATENVRYDTAATANIADCPMSGTNRKHATVMTSRTP